MTVRRTLQRAGVLKQATTYLESVVARYYVRRLHADAALQAQVARLERLRPIGRHYVHTSYAKPHEVLNISLYLAELTRTLEARLHRAGIDAGGARILDVGDPDGLVLQALGARRGVSLNILEPCVRQIRQSDGRPVQGDCARLPFASGVFDCVFCFETLEHLENPIAGLKELARVSRGSLYVAIPWVRRTVVREDGHDPKQPDPENHVFEFCHADFLKVLTHARLRVAYYCTIDIVGRIYNPLHLALLRRFYFPSNYPRFQFFELVTTA